MGLRSNTVMTAPALPSIEAIINGQTEAPQTSQESATIGGEAPKAPAEPPKEEISRLDQIERDQKYRRELFAREKRIKELEQKLGDTSNKTSILDSKNPIKDLAKAKGLSQDDVVKMALEAMDDDLTDEEKKSDLSAMSPEAIAKLVKEQLDAERKKEQEATQQQESIKNFKGEITTKAKELEAQHPLVSALGATEEVYGIISKQYSEDVEQYGEEYAQDNRLSIEDAIKKANDTLANNVKSALQSKYLRDFVMKVIKEDSSQAPETQSEDDDQLEEKPATLNNSSYRAVTETAGKPKFRTDADELEFLINRHI